MPGVPCRGRWGSQVADGRPGDRPAGRSGPRQSAIGVEAHQAEGRRVRRPGAAAVAAAVMGLLIRNGFSRGAMRQEPFESAGGRRHSTVRREVRGPGEYGVLGRALGRALGRLAGASSRRWQTRGDGQAGPSGVGDPGPAGMYDRRRRVAGGTGRTGPRATARVAHHPRRTLCHMGDGPSRALQVCSLGWITEGIQSGGSPILSGEWQLAYLEDHLSGGGASWYRRGCTPAQGMSRHRAVPFLGIGWCAGSCHSFLGTSCELSVHCAPSSVSAP